MTKFRSKVVEIEARRICCFEDIREINDWINKGGGHSSYTDEGFANVLIINTPICRVKAEYDDWVIRDAEGEFYPCKPLVFERKYEEINDGS